MQYYDGYVAFIDVLGFSQWITKTENIDKTNEFFEVVKMIKTLFDSNPEWKCKLYIFSDSVVMTSKVDYQRFFLAISLLENCLWEELDLLYRGGIAKGSFYEDDDNIVFGPAVVHAVELEKEAEESRIVLSNRSIRNMFGSENYAYEELIAEITSCFMASEFLPEETVESEVHLSNHKAYIQSWISAIKDKPEMLVKAVKEAQTAAAYMDYKAELITEQEYASILSSTKVINTPETKEEVKEEFSVPAKSTFRESIHGKIRKLKEEQSDGEAEAFVREKTMHATYMELKGYDFKKTNLLALSGVALPRGDGNTSLPGAIETLLEGRSYIKRFSIHFDNDTTGVAAANALGALLLSKGYETSISKVPEECGKDMNDYLLTLVNSPQKRFGK